MNTHPTLYDVAIVGYGPAGATLANLLGEAGLSVLVLDREAAIYPLPRAIHFDGEVMRVFQALGLRDRIEAIVRPGLEGMHFVNAEGETLMVRGGTSANGPHGCANNYYFHQPELEAILREGLSRYPSVQVRLQHEVLEIADRGDRVQMHVRDRATGTSSWLEACYAVGCDGARSLVRRTLGAPMKDLGLRQNWLVFDVLLNEDAPPMPTHTVQHCNPERPMTWCNVTGNRRRWEIMVLPGDDEAGLLAPGKLWHLVSRWLKPEHAQVERAVIYTFHSQVAQGWRKGRLMIAGDAAHLTPPFLGQGMCAAIRDVSNLAWKLKAVAMGQAADVLLDTYESERSPHVHAFIELAVRLGQIIQTTDPVAARERDARYRAGQPENFTFPAPRLGAGAWQGEQEAVGRSFPQPRLDDGRLFDERVGNRFALIGDEGVIPHLPQSLRAFCHDRSLVVLPARDAALKRWLQAHGASAAVIRPDRYVAALLSPGAQPLAQGSCVAAGELQPH